MFSAMVQDQFRRCIAEAPWWALNCSGCFLQLIILWYVGATENLFDLQDRESDDDREVLDTGGYQPKELRQSSQYIEHWKIRVDVK